MWKYAIAFVVMSPVMAQQGTYLPGSGASGVNEPVGICKQIANEAGVKIWIGDCVGRVGTQLLLPNGGVGSGVGVTYPTGQVPMDNSGTTDKK